MSDILNNLNNIFDLSYLSAAEYPESDFKSVGILGGGTAGYFAALALKRCHPNLKVTVIESSKIPVIGVGESTTTEILPFLHRLLDFNPTEFFLEVQPTLKMGIHFDWGVKDSHFNFNFFASHHHESYYYDKHIKNSNWPSVLMDQNKVPVINTDEGLSSFLNSIPFAYHLDNKKLVAYLRKKIVDNGIPIVDTEITSVRVNDYGLVDCLQSHANENFKFDFYIDCTGFRSKILGQALKTKYLSFKNTLATDTALIFQSANTGDIDPFTSAITMDCGWCWKIPMRTEDHYGYVYSSQYCTEEEALTELKAKFGDIHDHKIINFQSGRHEKAWNGNTFSLGNSYAFIEPLESTAIQSVIHSIMLMCRLMPKNLDDTSSIAGINKEIAANWDAFRWFLGIHYKFNNKKQTPFWKWCRENTDIGNAQMILDLFNHKAPLSMGHYGTSSGYAALEALIFNAYSYDTLLFGQNLAPKNLKQPEMSLAEYQSKCDSYKNLSSIALKQRDVLNLENFTSEILQDVFEDPNSWFADTPV